MSWSCKAVSDISSHRAKAQGSAPRYVTHHQHSPYFWVIIHSILAPKADLVYMPYIIYILPSTHPLVSFPWAGSTSSGRKSNITYVQGKSHISPIIQKKTLK